MPDGYDGPMGNRTRNFIDRIVHHKRFALSALGFWGVVSFTVGGLAGTDMASVVVLIHGSLGLGMLATGFAVRQYTAVTASNKIVFEIADKRVRQSIQAKLSSWDALAYLLAGTAVTVSRSTFGGRPLAESALLTGQGIVMIVTVSAGYAMHKIPLTYGRTNVFGWNPNGIWN